MIELEELLWNLDAIWIENWCKLQELLVGSESPGVWNLKSAKNSGISVHDA